MPPKFVDISGPGNVVLVSAPGAGQKVSVHGVQISVKERSDNTVCFRAGTTGAATMKFSTGAANVVPQFTLDPAWDLPENTALVGEREEGNATVTVTFNYTIGAV